MSEKDSLDEAGKVQLVSAYIARYSRPFVFSADNILEKTDENFWAYEKFVELVKFSPNLAFELIVLTLKETESDDVLENLAAGPLEDLVRLHGADFIEKIEAQAGADKKFRQLLGGIWEVGEPDVWARIERLVGNSREKK